MNSLIDFALDVIYNTIIIALIFGLLCIVGAVLFVMHWMHGTTLFMHQVGVAQFVESAYDPVTANWIMLGAVFLFTIIIIRILIKMIMVYDNGTWTFFACGLMLVVVSLPVYHSYTLDGFYTKVEDVRNGVTKTIETEVEDVVSGVTKTIETEVEDVVSSYKL